MNAPILVFPFDDAPEAVKDKAFDKSGKNWKYAILALAGNVKDLTDATTFVQRLTGVGTIWNFRGTIYESNNIYRVFLIE